MSDFFGLYVQELSSDLTKEALWEQTKDIPIANLGILGEVLHYGKAVITSGVELVPDFESLPKDIKEKFEKGIYKLGKSDKWMVIFEPLLWMKTEPELRILLLRKY